MGKRLTAKDIVHTFTPGDFSGDTSDDDQMGDFWRQRYEQSKWSPSSGGPSLFESIKEAGQQKPVSLNLETKEILDGHHRIAAMYRLNPNQFVKYKAWKPR